MRRLRSFLGYKLRGRLGPNPTARGFSAAPEGLDSAPEAVRRAGVIELADMPVQKRIPRILLANHPRLMRELLLRACDNEEELEVVGEVHLLRRLPLAVALTRPDCVVVSLYEDGTFPEVARLLRQRRPQLAVIGISSIGSSVRTLRDRQPRETTRIGDLVKTIHRHAVRSLAAGDERGIAEG